jgi:hypothetical protein
MNNVQETAGGEVNGFNYQEALTSLNRSADLLNSVIGENRELQKRVALLEAALRAETSRKVGAGDQSVGSVGDILTKATVDLSVCKGALESVIPKDSVVCVTMSWALFYVEKAAEIFHENRASLGVCDQDKAGPTKC